MKKENYIPWGALLKGIEEVPELKLMIKEELTDEPLPTLFFYEHYENFFDEVIPVLENSPKHAYANIKNRNRYFLSNILFQPKSMTEVLRTEKGFGKKRKFYKAYRKMISPVSIMKNDYFRRILIEKKKLNNKFDLYYSNFFYIFPTKEKKPIIENPFYRYYFVFSPLLEKTEEKLTGKLEEDTFNINNYFDEWKKILNLFLRIMRLSVEGKKLVEERYYQWDEPNYKLLEKDLEKLKFEFPRKTNNPYFEIKQKFTEKWIAEKKEEYKQYVISTIHLIQANEFHHKPSPEEEKYLQEEQEKRNEELLKEMKKSKKLNTKQKEL